MFDQSALNETTGQTLQSPVLFLARAAYDSSFTYDWCFARSRCLMQIQLWKIGHSHKASVTIKTYVSVFPANYLHFCLLASVAGWQFTVLLAICVV